MQKSVAEILDGFSISIIKKEKIPSKFSDLKYEKYKKGFEEVKRTYPNYNWDFILKMFINVNKLIWKYEAAIRLGVVDDDPYIIHTRTQLVREFNSMRVALGNLISLFLGELDELNLKKDHLSE